MSYTTGLPTNNQTLNGIISISDGSSLLIENGEITGCSRLEVDNLEVGNLQVDGEANINTANINMLHSDEIYSPYSEIYFMRSTFLSSTEAAFGNVSGNIGTFDTLDLSNIKCNNILSKTGTLSIGKLGDSMTLLGNIQMLGNVNYVGSNIVRYVDNNIELNVGGGNLLAQGAGLTVRGTGNVVAAELKLDSNLDWMMTSRTNKLTVSNISSTNVTSTNGTISTLNSTTGTVTTLNSTNGNIVTLTSNNGTVTTLNSTTGTVSTLNSTSGNITTLTSNNGTISTLNSTTGTVTTLNSTNGNIVTLTSNNGTVTTLNSTTGTVSTLNSTSGNISTLTSNNGTITTLSSTNATLGNITNTNLKSANIQVGDAPFNLQTGTRFYVRNTGTVDGNINGSISGNVWHQLGFGSRNWVFSQDTSNDGTMFLGCQGGGDPDPDLEYFYKRGVGLQIQPNPATITTDFNSALSVLGNVYVSKEINTAGNVNAPNVVVSNTLVADKVTANVATIDSLTCDSANIATLLSANANITAGKIDTLVSTNANITNLVSNNANIQTVTTGTIDSAKSLNKYTYTNRMVCYSSATNHLNVAQVKANQATVNNLNATNAVVNDSLKVGANIDASFVNTLGLAFSSFTSNLPPFSLYYGSYPINNLSPGTAYSYNVTFPNSFSFNGTPFLILVTSSSNAIHAAVATIYQPTGFTLVGRNLSGSSTVSGVVMYLAFGPA